MFAPPLSPTAWLRWHAIQPFLREIPGGARLVEVGCGQGGFGARLDRRFDYVGYEPDPLSAATAASRVRRGQVRNELLPAEPAMTCDALATFEVIEHFEDDVAALRDWRRWIRPGGRLLLSTPADPDRYGPWDRRAGHYRRYTPELLASALDAAGFTDIRVRRYGAPLLYLLEPVRHRLAGDGDGDMQTRTTVSGRQLQPPAGAAWVTALGTLPFRYLQGPLGRRGWGPGLVAAATA